MSRVPTAQQHARSYHTWISWSAVSFYSHCIPQAELAMIAPGQVPRPGKLSPCSPVCRTEQQQASKLIIHSLWSQFVLYVHSFQWYCTRFEILSQVEIHIAVFQIVTDRFVPTFRVKLLPLSSGHFHLEDGLHDVITQKTTIQFETYFLIQEYFVTVFKMLPVLGSIQLLSHPLNQKYANIQIRVVY